MNLYRVYITVLHDSFCQPSSITPRFHDVEPLSVKATWMTMRCLHLNLDICNEWIWSFMSYDMTHCLSFLYFFCNLFLLEYCEDEYRFLSMHIKLQYSIGVVIYRYLCIGISQYFTILQNLVLHYCLELVGNLWKQNVMIGRSVISALFYKNIYFD